LLHYKKDTHVAENDRDNLLRELAINPGRAMQRWKRLSATDRSAVLSNMRLFIARVLSNDSRTKSTGERRPDLTIEITNDSSITPEKLSSAGYQFNGDPGGVSKWVHPSGKEIWLLPPPRPFLLQLPRTRRRDPRRSHRRTRILADPDLPDGLWARGAETAI